MTEYENPQQGPTITMFGNRIEIDFTGCAMSAEQAIEGIQRDLPFWIRSAMNFRPLTAEDEGRIDA